MSQGFVNGIAIPLSIAQGGTGAVTAAGVVASALLSWVSTANPPIPAIPPITIMAAACLKSDISSSSGCDAINVAGRVGGRLDGMCRVRE